MTDFTFIDHGSIVLISPNNQQAIEFIRENVHYEQWQLYGNAVACEPRMATDIAQAVVDEGFALEVYHANTRS